MDINHITVTPEIAEQMLSKNDHNRPKSERRVAALSNAMKSGEWRQNGDTIRVSKTGVLLDGQHRLSAIVDSGISLDCIVVSGLEDEAFTTIDQGASRTTGQVLAIDGVSHYNTVAGATRLYIKYLSGKDPLSENVETNPTSDQIVKFVRENPYIMDAAALAARSTWLKKYVTARLAAFMILVFQKCDKDATNSFFEELESGYISYKGSPISLLRDRLMEDKASKYRMSSRYKLAICFKAFRAFRRSETLKILRVRTEGNAEKDVFKP